MATSTKTKRRNTVAVLDPETDLTVGELDIRLDDYLNDKFQTLADFKNLDSILASVELQKEQLDKQVRLHSPVQYQSIRSKTF